MKSGKAYGVLIGAGLVLALGVVAWQQSDLGRASRDVEAQRAAARREGVPIEWSDLASLTPVVDPAQNAAEYYRRGFATLNGLAPVKTLKLDALLKSVLAGGAKPEDLQKLKTALVAGQSGLAEVLQGTNMPVANFNRQWERGPDLLFPEYAYGRMAERLLLLRALTTTSPKEAAGDLTAAARLSYHLGSEPILISALVGSGMEMDFHNTVRKIGSRGGIWPAALVRAVAQLGPVANMRRVLAGEAVNSRQLPSYLAKVPISQVMGIAGEGSPAILRLSGFKPVRDAFEARSIEYWRKVYSILPQNPLEYQRVREAVGIPIPQSSSNALLELGTPVLSGLSDIGAKAEAERRLTQTALALWQGHSPELPNDPFAKGPLKLKRQGAEWKLWSVGPNGVDDGGKGPQKPSDPQFDLVVSSRP